MSTIDQLAGELARLPGIGPKTALRMVHHLLKGSGEDTRRLARLVRELADKVRPCQRCGNFSEAELCAVCGDPRRDSRVLCVVEEAYEVGAIERTGRFRGLYHVLGGRLSPLDGVGPEELNVDALLILSITNPAIFVNYIGIFDPAGHATSLINIPNRPPLVGVTIYTAFFTLRQGAPSQIGAISEEEVMTIVQ